jgi:transposase
VHANQTHLCALDIRSGEVRRQRVEGPPEAVLPILEELGEGTVAAYEAGPTGFGLARAGAERGFDVRIIAPGLIPKAPGDRVNLVRCRDDLRRDRMRARHRVLKLLLRQGLRYPGPGKNWTSWRKAVPGPS